MDRHWAYCSACDRQVEIMVRPGGQTDPETGETTDEIVCLEVGHTCTGMLCPITEFSAEEMREKMREAVERTGAEQSDTK